MQLKPVEQLTDREKFLIAVAAGVPVKMESRSCAGGVEFVQTTEPCDIVVVKDQYVVYTRKVARREG